MLLLEMFYEIGYKNDNGRYG